MFLSRQYPMVLFVWRFTKLIVRIKRRNETKQNEALRKLTKANESLGPSSQAPACAGGCFRWLSQRFVLFCFVSFRQNLFSVNQP